MRLFYAEDLRKIKKNNPGYLEYPVLGLNVFFFFLAHVLDLHVLSRMWVGKSALIVWE